MGTVYEHCLRAIDKALSRIGEHGLPINRCGDWNDGMNQVGAERPRRKRMARLVYL